MSPTPQERADAYRRWFQMRKDLRRTKIGDRQYRITRRSTGEEVGIVTMTGERSRDDYPWDVLTDLKQIGAQATLDDSLGQIAAALVEREER